MTRGRKNTGMLAESDVAGREQYLRDHGWNRIATASTDWRWLHPDITIGCEIPSDLRETDDAYEHEYALQNP